MLNNLSIARRILIIMAGGGLLLFGVTFTGWTGLQKMSNSLKSVYSDRMIPVIDLSEMMTRFDANYADVLRGFQHDPEGKTYVLHDHPTSEHIERIAKLKGEMDVLWTKYMATYLTEEEQALAKTFAEKRKIYEDTIVNPAVKALQDGDFSTAAMSNFLKGNRAIGKETRQALTDLMAYQASVAEAEHLKAEEIYNTDRMIFILLIIIGLSILGIFAWFTIRAITHSLQQAIKASEAIANGDLRMDVPQGGKDEAGQLLLAMATMQDKLRDMVRSSQDNARQLAQSAHELSTASAQSARASEAQSEAASGMAASVEQMTVSIDQVKDNANEAHSIANQSGEESRTGGQVVHSAAGEMAKIADAVNGSASTIRELEGYSNEISAIVNVIREIADQTNLLALNAAIEAARAGEQGRGFAVVADEVRKLAERTSNSTQQISGMIDKVQAGARRAAAEMEAGVTRVAEGVSLAHQAGDSITGIQQGTSRVADVIDDIAAALKEQAAASQNIAQGVEHIAQMSEENSSTVRQTASAAEHLQRLANDLQQSVARFRV